MKKLVIILKGLVFAVGLITLIFIALAGIMVLFDNFSTSRKTSYNQGPYIYYKTEFEKHKLVIQDGDGDADGVKMTITGPGKQSASLAMDYVGDITGSSIIPVGGGKYGIALFQDSADCDHTSYHIQFLTYDKTIRHIDTISLGARNSLDGGNRKFIATMSGYSPYIEDMKQWQFSIPVSVEIDREVTITPLITSEGAELIRQVMAKDRKAVMEKLSQKDMEEDLKRYLNAEKEANNVLATRRIKFL